MCDRLERLRCVLQRNTPGAMPCTCGFVKVAPRRFKDSYGRGVTILKQTDSRVTYIGLFPRRPLCCGL
jgi:hypothetical protein